MNDISIASMKAVVRLLIGHNVIRQDRALCVTVSLDNSKKGVSITPCHQQPC